MSNLWRCPKCGAVLRKGLGSLIGAGLVGTATCGGCGAQLEQSDVYGGKYDVDDPTSSSPSASSFQPSTGGLPGWCKAIYVIDIIWLVLTGLMVLQVFTEDWEKRASVNFVPEVIQAAYVNAAITAVMVLVGILGNFLLLKTHRWGVTCGFATLCLVLLAIIVQLWGASHDKQGLGIVLPLSIGRVVWNTLFLSALLRTAGKTYYRLGVAIPLVAAVFGVMAYWIASNTAAQSSPKTYRGKLTMDGAPLASMKLVFIQLDGSGKEIKDQKQMLVTTDQNGAFTLTTVPANYKAFLDYRSDLPRDRPVRTVPQSLTSKWTTALHADLRKVAEDGSDAINFDIQSELVQPDPRLIDDKPPDP